MFSRARFLFLLLGLIIFISVELLYSKRLKRAFFGEELKNIKKKLFIKSILYFLGSLFFILAMSEPHFGTKKSRSMQKSTELFFLLDISNSMNVNDCGGSRLDISKAIIKILNSELEKIKRGLIFFKGTSMLSLPLTLDQNIFDTTLDSISSMSLTSPGTNIESAMKLAIENFSKNNSVQKIILLLTDGDETVGSLKKLQHIMSKDSIICICIGIGTASGSEIKVYDENGNEKIIQSKLYEDTLKLFIENIVDKSSAGNKSFYIKYDEVNLINTLKKAIQDYSSHGQIITITEDVNQSNTFLLLSLCFLILGFLFGEHTWQK